MASRVRHGKAAIHPSTARPLRAWPAIGLAVMLLTQAVRPVSADGVVPTQYGFCSPPKFLASTNTQPRSVLQTIPLNKTGLSLYVTTPDLQATIGYSHGSFGHPAGATAVRVTIAPDCHPQKLPTTRTLVPDGNAYRFSFKYLPSGALVPGAHGILLTLEYPHTPFEMLGLSHGVWRPMCTQATLSLTPETATCRDNNLLSEVAMLYAPRGSAKAPQKRKAAGVSVLLIALIAIAAIAAIAFLGYAALRLFTTRKPADQT